MKIICKIVGHNWDKSDKARQICKRNHCLATRYLFFNPLKQMLGHEAWGWEIIDIDKIKIR
jgi:hypothetical protein